MVDNPEIDWAGYGWISTFLELWLVGGSVGVADRHFIIEN